MSELIKLKVPAEPTADAVSHGNFRAELTPNAQIETQSRPFADWLIANYHLAEIKLKTKASKVETVSPFAVGYAADFPGRDALVAAEIPFETTSGLTREQLLKVPSIGEQTAEAILAYAPGSPVEPLLPPVPNEPPANHSDEADSESAGNNSNTDGGAK